MSRAHFTFGPLARAFLQRCRFDAVTIEGLELAVACDRERAALAAPRPRRNPLLAAAKRAGIRLRRPV